MHKPLRLLRFVFLAAVLIAARLCGGEGRPHAPLNTHAATAQSAAVETASDVVAAVPSPPSYFLFAAPEEQGVVDRLTGTFGIDLVDLAVPAGAASLELTRAYASDCAAAGLVGSRWRLNCEARLIRDPTGARVVDTRGVTEFTNVIDQANVLESLSGEQIVWDANTAVRVQADGTRDSFSADGRLMQRCTQNLVTSFQYDTQGRVARIDASAGAFLVFRYPTERMVRVESSTGDAVTYVLGDGHLARVERTPGVSTDYAYDEEGRLVQISHPQFGSIDLDYDEQGRLAARRWADGSIERIAHAENGAVRHVAPDGRVTRTEFAPDQGLVTITEPSGRRAVMQFGPAGRLRKVSGEGGQSAQFAYDQNGRLRGMTGDDGKMLVFEYHGDAREPSSALGPDGSGYNVTRDTSGHIVRVQSGEGTSTSFRCDDQGRPLRIEAVHAPAMTLTYDEAGRVQTVTNAVGQVMRLEYDARGQLQRRVDLGGSATSWTRDDLGRVISETDACGATTRYEYASNGLLVALIDPQDAATRFTYHGRSVATADPLGAEWTRSYDPGGRIEREVDPCGAERRFEYDAAGNVTRVLDPLGGETRYEYDTQDRITTVATSDGRRIGYRYDESGKLREETDSLSQRTTYAYDEQGNLCTTADADGAETQWEVGPRGLRRRTVTLPRGLTTRFAYDAHGNLVSIVCDGRIVASYQYDALDRLVEETNDRGLTVRYEYDAMGNLIGWKDSVGRAESVSYDACGRPVITQDAMGGQAACVYDPTGQVVQQRNALGQVTRLAYDAAGRLTAVTRPSGRAATYQYDAAGRLAAMHMDNRVLLRVDRDRAGNPTQVTDALGRPTATRYDASGRVVAQTDGLGRTTSFVYSSTGLLLEKHLADGLVIHYAYDAFGNVTSLDDGQFPVRYSYDGEHRLVRIEYPAINRSLARRYDLHTGKLAELIDSEGRRFTYRYEASGRLTAIETARHGSFRFRYDAADRLTELHYPNGVVGHWDYDLHGRAAAIVYQDAHGEVLDGVWYDYDSAGRPVRKRSGVCQADYAYDPDGRLTEERQDEGLAVEYQYDAIGARKAVVREGLTEAYVTDAAGQLCSAGATSFEHDDEGNLTARTRNGRTTRHRYDCQNQLVEVLRPDGTSIHFGYAPTGDRIWREDEQGRTYYVTDGTHVWAELDAKLVPTVLYTHGPLIDRPLMVVRGQDPYFYHADALGSVTALTDGAGRVAQRYDYDAFGNLRGAATEAIANAFRFTGRPWDGATGLYYYRARYYDPALGQFLTKDPLAQDRFRLESISPYTYAWNNPVQYVDSAGTQTTSPSADASGAGSGSRLGFAASWVAAQGYDLVDRLHRTVDPAGYVHRTIDRAGLRQMRYDPTLTTALGHTYRTTPGRAEARIGPEAVRRGAQQVESTAYHEGRHIPQIKTGLAQRLTRNELEQAAHRETALYGLKKGFDPDLTEASIRKYEKYGGKGESLRAELQSLGYGGPKPTGLIAAQRVTSTAGLIGHLLVPANLVANYLENGSGWSLLQEGTVHAVGYVTMAGITKGLAAAAGPYLAGTALAAAAPYVAAPAALVGVGYGTQKTAERLGEAWVAHQQNEQADRRRVNLTQRLFDGDHLAVIERKVAELEGKKQAAEFALNAAQGFVSNAIEYALVAERNRTAMDKLRPGDDGAAPQQAANALMSEADALAGQCEGLADQVIQRLASGAPGTGLIVDSPQVAALVNECQAVVDSIGASVESCRGKHDELSRLVPGPDAGRDQLAQAESLLGTIHAAHSRAQHLIEPTRQQVDTSRGLRAEVLQQVPELSRQIGRLIDQVSDTSTPEARAIHSHLRNLAGRTDALSVFEQPHDDRLTQDATAQAVQAGEALSGASALLESIRQAVPTEEASAADAVARAEAAHQRALAAMLAFLSHLRSDGESDNQELAGDRSQDPIPTQDDPDMSDLFGLIGEPAERRDSRSGQGGGRFGEPVGPAEPSNDRRPPPADRRSGEYEPVLVEGSLASGLSDRLRAAAGGATVQVKGSKIRLDIDRQGSVRIPPGQVDVAINAPEGEAFIRLRLALTFRPASVSTKPETMVPDRVEGVCVGQAQVAGALVAGAESGTGDRTGRFVAIRQADDSWLLSVRFPMSPGEVLDLSPLEWWLK